MKCLLYHQANITGQYSPVFHPIDDDPINTNLLESNPLRCHNMEIVQENWGSHPIYVFHYRQFMPQFWVQSLLYPKIIQI